MFRQSTIWLPVLTVSMMLLLCLPQLQGQDDSTNIRRAEEIRLLVDYLELNLNTLGDPKVPTAEKDIIIQESWSKFFQDDKVQVEDDLDPNRQVPIRKNVQAYLQDVEFFFRSVRFQYREEDISYGLRANGCPYWKVSAVRSVIGEGIRGDSIQGELERFIEINEHEGNLEIASIYTTGLGRREESRLWWASLSQGWKIILAQGALLTEEIPLASVEAWTPSVLVAAGDTFLLRNWDQSQDLVDSNQLIWYGDTLAVQDLKPISLGARELDLFLEGLTELKKLNLAGQRLDTLQSLDPLSRFTQLRELDLSYTGIRKADALRSLRELQILRLSGNPIEDLKALRYLQKLQILEGQDTHIRSDMAPIRSLVKLDLSGSPLDSAWECGLLPKLEFLDLSATGILSLSGLDSLPALRDLDLSGTQVRRIDAVEFSPGLKLLDISGTPVVSLRPLSSARALEQLEMDATPIEDLSPLAEVSALRRVYTDRTGIDEVKARAFAEVRPDVLVIHATDYLQTWWNGLDAAWRDYLRSAVGFEAKPDKEDLEKITELRQINLDADQGLPLLSTLEPVRKLTELERLSLNGQKLISEAAALEGLRMLDSITAVGSGIRDLDMLGAHERLRWLDCRDCRSLKSLDGMRGLPALTVVLADGSGLTDITSQTFRDSSSALLVNRSKVNLSWWSNLDSNWHVILERNLQEASDLSLKASALDTLQQSITLERLVNLPSISIEEDEIYHLDPISTLKELRELDFASNRVHSLEPLRSCLKLRALNASGNPLSDLSTLRVLVDLEKVSFEDTPIEDLGDLVNCRDLKELSFAGTPIRSLRGLSGMTRLRVLDCSNTKVRSLKPIEELKKLRELVIFNSPVSPAKVNRFRMLRPEIEVRYY